MRLIHFELRMSHIDGPEHDWWTPGDERVTAEQESREVTRMVRSDRYRNVWVEDDPHDDHHGTVKRSLSGLDAHCTVPDCTWFWSYD